MSDSAPVSTADAGVSAPVESSPVTTSEIAANVIAEAEGSSESSGYSDTRIDTTNTAEAPAPAAPPVELTPAEKFLLEQGHKARKDDGREPWLRYSTVKGMLDRYVNQHQSTWQGEKGTLETQLKEMRGHLDSLRAGLTGDPKAFLSELAGIDPRYRSFLEPPAPVRQEPPVQAQMPEPDLTLGDGSRTYSMEGLKKLLEWNTAQVEQRLLPKVDERLQPFTEREKAEQQRAAIQQAEQMAHSRAQDTLKEAQSWPFFGKLAEDGTLSEFQQAVFEELRKDTDKKLTLHAAYIKVAGQRFSEDENTRRERILKEINQAPKAPAIARQTTDAPRAQGPRSTSEIARSVIAQAERGA